MTLMERTPPRVKGIRLSLKKTLVPLPYPTVFGKRDKGIIEQGGRHGVGGGWWEGGRRSGEEGFGQDGQGVKTGSAGGTFGRNGRQNL